MDTYFDTNCNCVACGKCVEVCPRDEIMLFEWYNPYSEKTETYVDTVCDYVGCHHCDGFWDNNTPCLQVCEMNAIKITRW